VSDIVLLKAVALAEAFPGRWWVPAPDLLDAIEPGRTRAKVLAVEPDTDCGANPWAAKAIWMAIESRDDAHLMGPIQSTQLDRDGYRAGDALCVPQDRVIDLVFIGSEGRPVLNEARARFMFGKRALVGLDLMSETGDLIEQSQFTGIIARVDPADGIQLVLDDQSVYWLPPDARSFEEAAPGEYTLRSNGQTVVNPDYIATWTITQGYDGYVPPSDGFRAR
jgi:hypothetical protein